MSDWISSNTYLSQSDRDNNAMMVYAHLSRLGYSYNAMAAILGNMWRESGINPGLWESFIVAASSGYGLCQWTPSTKLTNWLTLNGLPDNGDSQVEFLDQNSGQWGNSGNPAAPSVTPPITWQGFKTSTLAVQTLTEYFMYYWERPSYDPSINGIADRIEWAEYYYEMITGTDPPLPPGPYPTRTRKKKFPWAALHRLVMHN